MSAVAAAPMRVEFINPFVSAAVAVFDTMLGTSLQRGKIFLDPIGKGAEGVTGVIGLTGQAIGTAAITLTNEAAIECTRRFVGSFPTEVDDEVVDCVGELINMVAGHAKAQLEEYNLSISLPSIVRGRDHRIEFPSNVVPIGVPFDCDFGKLELRIGFRLL